MVKIVIHFITSVNSSDFNSQYKTILLRQVNIHTPCKIVSVSHKQDFSPDILESPNRHYVMCQVHNIYSHVNHVDIGSLAARLGFCSYTCLPGTLPESIREAYI